MKRFIYRNAETITDAVSQLRKGNTAILAGGTDILNLLKTEAFIRPPELLVNIKNIPGLDIISHDASGLKIGALTKISTIASSELIKAEYPALAEAAKNIASPAIREMGTIAGNLCQEVQCWYFRRSFLTGNSFNCLRKSGQQCYAVTGDNRYHAIFGGKGCFAVCSSDMAVPLTALDAVIVTDNRVIRMTDFYTVTGNVLNNDEIITGIHLPGLKPETRQVFIKFALRPALDFAIVSTSVVITIDKGKVSDSRIVLGGVAPMPWRVAEAEDILKNNVIDEPLAESAAAAVVKSAKPLSHNKYKVQISKTLIKRAILTCNS